jgi:hypothetical protein
VRACLLLLLLLQAEKLVGRLDQLRATAGDLGLSMFKVAKFEVRLGQGGWGMGCCGLHHHHD